MVYTTNFTDISRYRLIYAGASGIQYYMDCGVTSASYQNWFSVLLVICLETVVCFIAKELVIKCVFRL